MEAGADMEAEVTPAASAAGMQDSAAARRRPRWVWRGWYWVWRWSCGLCWRSCGVFRRASRFCRRTPRRLWRRRVKRRRTRLRRCLLWSGRRAILRAPAPPSRPVGTTAALPRGDWTGFMADSMARHAAIGTAAAVLGMAAMAGAITSTAATRAAGDGADQDGAVGDRAEAGPGMAATRLGTADGTGVGDILTSILSTVTIPVPITMSTAVTIPP